MAGQAALRSDCNPRNTTSIPVVKIIAFLDLEQNISFLEGYQLCVHPETGRFGIKTSAFSLLALSDLT
jgi:hypothetical protein